MSIPKKAKLEAVLPGKVAIYDISHILPKPKKWSHHKRPRGTKIVRMFFHHSGKYGADGYKGALNSVNYVINSRDFGSRPYHFWFAYKPDVDDDGNIVVYRLAPDSERTWHTGGRANDEGLGAVFQGNLSPSKDGPPSDDQLKMAEAVTQWNVDRHNLSLPNGLSFHSEAKRFGAPKNKPSCPGPFIVKWVKNYRSMDESEHEIQESIHAPGPSDFPISESKEPVDETMPTNIENKRADIPKPKKINGWFGKPSDNCLSKFLKRKK